MASRGGVKCKSLILKETIEASRRGVRTDLGLDARRDGGFGLAEQFAGSGFIHVLLAAVVADEGGNILEDNRYACSVGKGDAGLARECLAVFADGAVHFFSQTETRLPARVGWIVHGPDSLTFEARRDHAAG